MSRISSLSRSHHAALIAATLIIGSAAPALAADHNNGSRIVLADARVNGAAEQSREVASVAPFPNENGAHRLPVQRPWPAPVGHRQPRVSDVPVNIQLSSTEREEQRRDRELDAKLVICRGC